ncbi:hypothetical protein ACF0H5_022969 [Mactra antiquata]
MFKLFSNTNMFKLIQSGIILVLGFDVVYSCCPNGWVTFENSCYFSGHEGLSFQEAGRYCEHFKAYLVNIETPVENIFIKSYLADLKEPKHWIGLTDITIEGIWNYYPSEKAATYLNWSPGQPDEHKRANCAAVWESYSYNWVDQPCTEHFRPLCEKPLESETTNIVG